MSSLDLELDGDLIGWDAELRRAYEAARADYQRVHDCARPNRGLIDVARLRMQRAADLKGRRMADTERADARSSDAGVHESAKFG